jgi:hypothetical protein
MTGKIDVDVLGESYEVSTRQKLKYSWVAYGPFRGRWMQGVGETEVDALDDWKYQAISKADHT